MSGIRANRRPGRNLAQAKRVVAKGIASHHFDKEEFVSLMIVARHKLQMSIERKSVSPLMHFVYSNLRLSRRNLQMDQLACRKGCAHCCHIWVDAYAPEIFYAAKAIKLKQPEQSSPGMLVSETVAARLGRLEVGDEPQPCTLLVDNQCSQYSNRPLNCRTATSTNDEACFQNFKLGQDVGIPRPEEWFSLGRAYSLALQGAMIHAGLAYQPSEWNAALAVASRTCDAETQWLLGNDVFADIPQIEGRGAFVQPFWKSLYFEAFGVHPFVA